MSTLTTYDPAQLIIVFGGARLTGLDADTFLEIEFNADLFAVRVGADGNTVRAKSNNRSARITFTALQGATANVILGAALAADKAVNSGSLPLSITDLHSNSEFFTTGAWVSKDPGRTYARESTGVSWVLETHNLETVHGTAL